eukprot:scaffold229_cov28-Tisochrysis_lutea.AAC.1
MKCAWETRSVLALEAHQSPRVTADLVPIGWARQGSPCGTRGCGCCRGVIRGRGGLLTAHLREHRLHLVALRLASAGLASGRLRGLGHGRDAEERGWATNARASREEE